MKRNHSVIRHLSQVFMKLVCAVSLFLAAAVAPAFAAAPAWDSSGNSQLNGTYYFRQVIYATDSSGNASAFYAYYGNIVFSGTGTYTVTSGTFLEDNSQGFQSNTNATTTGTYSVSASGYGFMQSPLISGANVIFLVSNRVLIGSDTESGYNDMFIAAPYTAAFGLSSLSGGYTINALLPGVTAATVSDATFQLNPDGAGHLNSVSISGYSGAGATLSQSSSGVTYKAVNGAFPITFPTNNNAVFYSGQVYLYMSPDSNFVFGGSPTGFDMFVGVRNASSGASTPLTSGLYYEAGLDENQYNGLDSYYGVFNTFQGNIIGHERLLFAGSSAEGYSYYDNYPTTIANSYLDASGTTKYTVGSTGIRIGFGVPVSISGVSYAYPSIAVALPFTPPGASGSVYIDPTGVVNSGSSAPYTAGISPGEFITLYNGVNLANSTVFTPSASFPSTLGGVKVLVDGIAAPLYYVSPTQVSFVVPYEVTTFSVASIQVNNNGLLSNVVTAYVNQTTPGVFTNPEGGISDGAMIDFPASGGSYYIVSESKPVQPGDTVALYLTGLGTPFPPSTDGALGGTSCLSGTCLVNSVAVDIGGTDVGALGFAGLAPGEVPGLYQINFTVPVLCTTSTQTGCVTSGDNALGITGKVTTSTGVVLFDSYSNESLIPVGTGIAGSARPATDAKPAIGGKRLPRLSKAPSR